MNKFAILFFLSMLIILNSCNLKESGQLNMEKYFAWCIVPFDNQNRTPEQRIEMLKELGFVSYAYDYREKHLPEMAKEFNLAADNGIQVNAVWLWIDKNDSIGNLTQNNLKVLQSIKESGLKTQIWMSYPEDYFNSMTDEESLYSAIMMISYLSELAEELECKVGLYNHGGWFGNPDNLVKIVEGLPHSDVGIIFNFHHAHHLLDDYSALVENMLPHLWAVNLNGMNREGPKILTIGEGSEEKQMLELLKEKGYKGLFGILGHRTDADVKEVLDGNLRGLESILQ
ncbi:MAG: AP endonuclease [Prolixibacteraceae bacterium]|jgi:sugar phosphate isomerase/epimerase|nr:AP endonuclease [Prolixibacteraceae bacterium]MBT6005778.1 AP endonuclease [Prolixibacteraceae bacterium]MBT6765361.1 AP endonuclease [Prolixibacteraceae bacterium]MBT6998158.1 AP endonuclease [Prolixibacteraceae bacterium]MBT7395700.1 AP endonuclease [Prolixibacteraceae bacterium]